MKSKTILLMLVGILALCLFGCEREKPPAAAGEGNTPGGGTTAKQETGVEPATPAQPTTPQAPGTAGTAQDTMAQQKTMYVQGAEKTLNDMEQKLAAWQKQAGAQAQQDEKAQQLSKQVQTQIADARAAVEKMKTATGDQLKDAKVAADQAIQGAAQAFKNLQSYKSESQVTQAE